MPGGGAKPGERRGGRQKGALNKKTILKREIEWVGPSHELSIESLERGSIECENNAIYFRPTTDAEIKAGKELNPNANLEEYKHWMDRWFMWRRELAQYQSPKLKAIAILPKPDVDEEAQIERRKRFTLTVFEGGMGLQKQIDVTPKE